MPPYESLPPALQALPLPTLTDVAGRRTFTASTVGADYDAIRDEFVGAFRALLPEYNVDGLLSSDPAVKVMEAIAFGEYLRILRSNKALQQSFPALATEGYLTLHAILWGVTRRDNETDADLFSRLQDVVQSRVVIGTASDWDRAVRATVADLPIRIVDVTATATSANHVRVLIRSDEREYWATHSVADDDLAAIRNLYGANYGGAVDGASLVDYSRLLQDQVAIDTASHAATPPLVAFVAAGIPSWDQPDSVVPLGVTLTVAAHTTD